MHQSFPKPEPRQRTKGRKDFRCERCERSFTREHFRGASKFCSHACYFAMSRERRQRLMIQCRCEQCGASFTRHECKVKGKGVIFCSPQCCRLFHVGQRSASWRGGSKTGRGSNWKKRAAAVRYRDHYICRWCGTTESETGRAMAVDHVRPWREFESEVEANDQDNLVSLCASCHGKKARLENRWLKGDWLALQEYRRHVGVPGPVDKPLSPVDPHRIGPPRPIPDYKARGAAISAAKLAFYADPANRIRASRKQSAESRSKLSVAAKAQWERVRESKRKSEEGLTHG